MRIAVDLDGVCYEWERTARYMLREYRGCKGLELQSTHWDWIKERVSPADWKWLWSEAVQLGLFRYGHCVRGSVVGLRSLIGSGHSVLAVTHRPNAAVPDTLAWLAYNQIPWTEVHILSGGEAKSSIEADLLIDDKVENIKEWALTTKKPALLYDRPWNKRYDSGMIWRVPNWKAVVDCVRSL